MAILGLETAEAENYKRFYSTASLTEEDIPTSAQNRKKTDKHFLTAFLVLAAVLIGFLIYTLLYADINRLIKGYDNCGNVCGEKNVEYGWYCTGQDMTDKPIYHDGKCISKKLSLENITRPPYDLDSTEEFGGNDNEDERFEKGIFQYFQDVGWSLTFTCAISLGLCITLICMFRYATAVTVWGTLILSWLYVLVVTIFVWCQVLERGGTSILAGLTMSVVAMVLLCVIFFMQKKVSLLIMLIKESTKAVFDMPQIFFSLAATIFGVLVIVASWYASTIYMLSAGRLMRASEGHLEYVPDVTMILTMVLNTIMTYWALQFIIGFQYMVISGAVSKWYFTKDKNLLGNPVLTSAIITWKFHLGTVALGSLIIALVALLRATMYTLAKNPRLRILVIWCVSYIESFVRFLTKNAFIVTAMHGTPFLKSGKHAVTLLTLNVCNTVVVTSIGHFVIRMSAFFIIGLSGLITYLILWDTPLNFALCAILVVLLISLIFACSILGTLEIVFDTMFLCFCEDCLLNDGVTKPYAMSRDLMEFVESSKKVFAKKIEEKGLPTI